MPTHNRALAVILILPVLFGLACTPSATPPSGTTVPTISTSSTVAPTTTTPPPPAEWPTPQTTGVPTGLPLTAYTGPTTITKAGTIIDSKSITACLDIRAANVIVRRSLIRCAGDYGVIARDQGTNLLLEDVEVTSTAVPGSMVDRAIALTDGGTLRRVYVHGTQRGIAMYGDHITVTDSWIGGNVNGTDAHTSAIGAWGGTDYVTLTHNVLRTERDTDASSSISVYPESGPNTNWVIDGNNLSSGGGYVVYLGYTPPGEQPNAGMRFTNNRFNTDNYPAGGVYGPVASWSTAGGSVWSGNTWLGGPNDGTPVTP